MENGERLDTMNGTLLINMIVLLASMACSTGHKTGNSNVKTPKTIQLPDASIPEWQAERDFLLSDHVPQYCTAVTLNNSSLACLAAFGSDGSRLWHFSGNEFVRDGIKVPYARIDGLTKYNGGWLATAYEQQHCTIVIADDSFASAKEMPFPHQAVIGPLVCSRNNIPELAWTEAGMGTSLFTCSLTEDRLYTPEKIYSTPEAIYELASGIPDNNKQGCPFAFTQGVGQTAYVLQPGSPAKAMWNGAYNLELLTLERELYLSSAITDPATQASTLVIGKTTDPGKAAPDTVLQFTGGTSIFSVSAIPWKEHTIVYSVVTKKPVSMNNVGEVHHLVFVYDVRAKSLITAGRITPAGLQHNGYIENDTLVLLFARERIYLSVFSLKGLRP